MAVVHPVQLPQQLVALEIDGVPALGASLRYITSDHGVPDGQNINAVEHQEHPNKGTTFGRTCLNVTNSISGMGVLSMPYALSEGGWLGLVVFTVIAIICCYTGILMRRCMVADPHIRSYPDIGEFAFGSKGRLTTAIFVYLELYLIAVSFLILEGDNLHKLFPNVSLETAALKIRGEKLFIILAALVILPTTWLKNLSILGYVSAGGLLATVLLLGSLVWTGVVDTGFKQGGRLFNLSGLPIAQGLYLVCFTAHGVFPTIHTSMKNRSQFSKVLLISFFLSTINYGLMAILGYLMYGDHVESQVTLNLPIGQLYSKIAICTTVIIPLTKYALVITPVANAVEELLGFQKKILPSLLIRTLLLVSTVVIAVLIPLFGYLMAFTGSFFSVMISVLLPCTFYLKICKNLRRHRLETVIIIGIIIVGILAAIVGTYSSVREIVHNL